MTTALREQICLLAQSMSDRGLTGGRTGNISARTPDGGLPVSPTKEMPLHSAFYDTRSTAGAVVHLHSCHSIAWSMMPDADVDDFLPPMTPYAIMKPGRVKLLPFFRPGDPAMGEAGRGLAGKRSAVMLANHGPLVTGKDVEAACNSIEELEGTARMLEEGQVHDLVTHFNIEWDD